MAVSILIGIGSNLAVIVLLIVLYRSVRRHSRVMAALLAVGVVSRSAVGLALFWTSYLDLAAGGALNLGGGFWGLAADARGYFGYAVDVLEAGIWSANYVDVSSPFYVVVLAIWMALVGISPAAGLLLNVVVYALAVWLLVRAFRPTGRLPEDLPCALAIAAYTFSPVMFIHSTQVLKEELSYLLIVVIALGLGSLLARVIYGQEKHRSGAHFASTAVAVMAATYGLAGVRWYFPWIVFGCVVFVLIAGNFLRRRRFVPYLAGAAAILVLIWVGAGGTSNPVHLFIAPALAGDAKISSLSATIADLPGFFRKGFLLTGGNTNVTVAIRSDSPPTSPTVPHPDAAPPATPSPSSLPPPAPLGVAAEAQAIRESALREPEHAEAAKSVPRRPIEHVRAALAGLAIVFVPVTLLEAVGFLSMDAGRSFLLIADVDTVFQDLAAVALMSMLWMRRRVIGGRLPLVLLALALAASTGLLLGYVVTNYGTLFRMRPLILVPLCVAMVGLSSTRLSSQPESSRGRNPPGAAV